MPGLYRHLMRQGLSAISKLHTREHDLDRLTLHAMDLERTLYKLAVAICVDKLVNLDEKEQRATPHDQTLTFLCDPWTQAQLFAVLDHAAELTSHVCESCEGNGEDCVSCNGSGEIAKRVTNEDRIRALLAGLKPEDIA